MTERVAIPAWGTPPTTIAAWVEALETHLGPVDIDREGPNEAWLDVQERLVRGFAVIEGPHVSAVNFEIEAEDPLPAVRDLDAACLAIGWELHIDDEDGPDDDDTDDL
jgi:hypothetical protein